MYRYGELTVQNDVSVDNVYNILAGKLTAVLGRDEEKIEKIMMTSKMIDMICMDIKLKKEKFVNERIV